MLKVYNYNKLNNNKSKCYKLLATTRLLVLYPLSTVAAILHHKIRLLVL